MHQCLLYSEIRIHESKCVVLACPSNCGVCTFDEENSKSICSTAQDSCNPRYAQKPDTSCQRKIIIIRLDLAMMLSSLDQQRMRGICPSPGYYHHPSHYALFININISLIGCPNNCNICTWSATANDVVCDVNKCANEYTQNPNNRDCLGAFYYFADNAIANLVFPRTLNYRTFMFLLNFSSYNLHMKNKSNT